MSFIGFPEIFYLPCVTGGNSERGVLLALLFREDTIIQVATEKGAHFAVDTESPVDVHERIDKGSLS